VPGYAWTEKGVIEVPMDGSTAMTPTKPPIQTSLFEVGIPKVPLEAAEIESPALAQPVRVFTTGATRDGDNGKLKYAGFFCPLVLKRFAEYMHEHRLQKDGAMRAPDNWQKGMPLEVYNDSLVRHVMDEWLIARGYAREAVERDEEKVLCAILFNAMGKLHELLKARRTA
jgi:hypothetical protein